MVDAGLRPRTDEEGVVELNVGGSHVTVSWHLLAETEGFEDSTLGSLLEGVWGEGRIPRDADGRIVLDESPACTKQIIHTMLTGRASSVFEGQPGGGALSVVATDEIPCHTYTANILGLWRALPDNPRYPTFCGGSTVLEPFEIAPLGAKIREWVGIPSKYMVLLYRATRDGLKNKALKASCDSYSSSAVSLFRVSSGQRNDGDSVVGGYRMLPWDDCFVRLGNSGEMFAFMLKDGSATRKDVLKPTKWEVGRPGSVGVPNGLLFGEFDLETGGCALKVASNFSRVEEGSPFLALNGNKVVDFEVYRCSEYAPARITAPSTTKPDGNVSTDTEARDIRSFGEIIASSFMEERVILDRAVKEMEAAGARISSTVFALKTVYGPSVAAGKQDAVVELNVRGTRMTTLRSTLQACPRSALAAMFNEERWPATDKDKDEHGRRLIDCDPVCFSKILDVLRVRKRASWSRGAARRENDDQNSDALAGAVRIDNKDVETFLEAVNMYFPGCESFVKGLVRKV